MTEPTTDYYTDLLNLLYHADMLSVVSNVGSNKKIIHKAMQKLANCVDAIYHDKPELKDVKEKVRDSF